MGVLFHYVQCVDTYSKKQLRESNITIYTDGLGTLLHKQGNLAMANDLSFRLIASNHPLIA